MNPAEIIKKVNEHAPDHGADCDCELTPMIDAILSATKAMTELNAQFAILAATHPALAAALGLAQIDPTPTQERPKPANVGSSEGMGLEGALIGARETKPERPREGE